MYKIKPHGVAPRLCQVVFSQTSQLPPKIYKSRELKLFEIPPSPHTYKMSVQEHKVVTELPGPKSQECAKQLGTVFDARAVQFVADYENSSGN